MSMGQVLDMRRTEPHVEPLTGLTPWEVCQRLADQKHLLFLDSAQRSELGRYSYVSADPPHVITSQRGWISVNGRFEAIADPLMALADRLADFTCEPIDELPPFQGGAAGVFGYELCHHIEVLPRPQHDDFGMPDLAVGIYDWVIAFDHMTEQAWLISTGYPENDPRQRDDRARQRADEVKRWLDRRAPIVSRCSVDPIAIETPQFPADGHPGLTSNFAKQQYLDTIARAIEYIHAGDCFQVNIAQRLMTPARLAPLDLYARLRELSQRHGDRFTPDTGWHELIKQEG